MSEAVAGFGVRSLENDCERVASGLRDWSSFDYVARFKSNAQENS